MAKGKVIASQRFHFSGIRLVSVHPETVGVRETTTASQVRHSAPVRKGERENAALVRLARNE
jgi:hypothetical protein